MCPGYGCYGALDDTAGTYRGKGVWKISFRKQANGRVPQSELGPQQTQPSYVTQPVALGHVPYFLRAQGLDVLRRKLQWLSPPV